VTKLPPEAGAPSVLGFAEAAIAKERPGLSSIVMHDLSLLTDLVVIFAAAVLVVLVLSRIGLPSIAGLIVAGVLVGPRSLGLISERASVEVLAEVGVILLLFGVGLELPVSRLKQLLRPMLLTGSLQVMLTIVCAGGLAYAAGLTPTQALILALVIAPSSTAIVLRQLDARGELDAPHGQQMLGILLFQDLCVVPMMLVLPALTGEHADSGESVSVSLLRSLGVLIAVVVAARLIAPRVLHLVAQEKKRDVFVLAVFVVGVGTAWAASLAGVSLSLGAFLAGVVIAGSDYRHQAMGDLIPFREVFASLFFVSAGMLLDLSLVFSMPRVVLGLFLLLLLGKGLLVLAIGLALRLSLRVSVLTAIGLCQVGEFALVLLASVREQRALPEALEAQLLCASILSMIATPLLLAVAPRFVLVVERVRVLRAIFGQGALSSSKKDALSEHVIIAGYGVAGRALAHRLQSEGMTVVVVDLNTRSVKDAESDGFQALYGDIATPEVLAHLGAQRAVELVLLINDASALERAVESAHRTFPALVITVRSRYQGEVAHLKALGATHVVAAEVEAGRTITEQVLRRSIPAGEVR
jgi:CPA2 family monovalent cation:H+ antiporter-2